MLIVTETKNKIARAVMKHTISRSIWTAFRTYIIFYHHRKVAKFWRTIINPYFARAVERSPVIPLKELMDEKVIWQYWGQGLGEEHVPELVKICFDSVDKYRGEFQIIRLTDETVHNYLEFPDFVVEKRGKEEFRTVFFSDLLRIALLQKYGGVWLDATVLLTGPLPEKFSELNYFAYQRDINATHKNEWKDFFPYYWGWNSFYRVNLLNSIIFAKKNNPIITVMLDLMLHYWKTKDEIIDYFFFQILYDELLKNEMKDHICEIIDDTLPHLLMGKIFGLLGSVSTESIFEKQSLHKLTYFTGEKLELLKDIMSTNLAENATKKFRGDFSI